MRLLVATSFVLICTTGVAQAGTKHWSRLTLKQKHALVESQIRAARTAVRWWVNYQPQRRPASARPTFPLVRCAAIGIRAPGWVCIQGQHLVRALKVERRLNARIAAVAHAKLLASFPPHMKLWLCIHGHEAADWQNNDTGHNLHYGGLQMHRNWGYGTSEYASSDSELTIVWAAEHAYIASGYSKSWLMGQWYHPDCLQFA